MRKSRYTLVVDCHDGHEVLYSSINGALAVVEGGLDAILRDPDEEEIKQLIDDEFVVNDSTDDDRLRNDFLEDCFFGVGSLEMTILTTYDCNFACPYCFQETMHGPKYMSHTVAGSLLAWIERIADSTDLSHLGVGVTGGEPLLTQKYASSSWRA